MSKVFGFYYKQIPHDEAEQKKWRHLHGAHGSVLSMVMKNSDPFD
jgi:hypothetical protein